MSDLISRQAAIKDAESWIAVDKHEKHLQKNVVEWLKEFPSAEPERKRGKWDPIGYTTVRCTNCGGPYTKRPLVDLQPLITEPFLPKFCPNCGSYNGGDSE